jgi:hypothetical protein
VCAGTAEMISSLRGIRTADAEGRREAITHLKVWLHFQEKVRSLMARKMVTKPRIEFQLRFRDDFPIEGRRIKRFEGGPIVPGAAKCHFSGYKAAFFVKITYEHEDGAPETCTELHLNEAWAGVYYAWMLLHSLHFLVASEGSYWSTADPQEIAVDVCGIWVKALPVMFLPSQIRALASVVSPLISSEIIQRAMKK